MTSDHYSQALDHIHAVQETRESLREMYREQHRDPRDVARLNGDLGDALKLAAVHADLAIVEAIDNLADVIAGVVRPRILAGPVLQ